MDSLDSGLARLNSKISLILLAMTRANHHSLNHATEGPIACSPSWDTSAIVRLFPIGNAFITHGYGSTSFLSIFFAMGSQFDRSPLKWDVLCVPGSHVTDDRRLGRLWDLEVRKG